MPDSDVPTERPRPEKIADLANCSLAQQSQILRKYRYQFLKKLGNNKLTN